MRGSDPRIQLARRMKLDCRGKPGNNAAGKRHLRAENRQHPDCLNFRQICCGIERPVAAQSYLSLETTKITSVINRLHGFRELARHLIAMMLTVPTR